MKKKDLRRKKLIAGIVSAALLFCGCAAETPDGNMHVPDENTAEILEEYVSEIDRYETPYGVFGAENSYILMYDNFVARILYPLTGNDELDRKIEEYVRQTAEKYGKEASSWDIGEGQTAELTMGYEGYIADKRFIGVKMTGVFDGPFMAHPEDILKTFNGKKGESGLVDITDIIDGEKLGELCMMTADATGAFKESVDEEIIENWNLTGRGLEITLERGKYGPMSDGTRSVFFAYDELGGFLTEKIEEAEYLHKDEQTDPHTETVVIPSAEEPDPEKPMIALTFDDGPGAYTDRLLDILQKYEVQATFFLLGNKIDKRPETVQRMVEEGHEIGGHSWSHKELTKLTEKEIRTQIVKTNDKINEFTGLTPTVMRPPFGSYDDHVRAVAKKLGVSAVNWNVDTLDWKNKDAEHVYEAAMKGMKEGNIILFHDIHPTTVEAMEKIVPALLEEGYQLVTVSQLLTSGDREMIPGGLYFKR